MTGEQLYAALKALPPNELDNIPPENIDKYEELGPIGWHHVMDHYLCCNLLELACFL